MQILINLTSAFTAFTLCIKYYTSHIIREVYLLTCAPNENSNQPARPRSLIWVFVDRMKKFYIFGFPKCVVKILIILRECWALMSGGTCSAAEAHTIMVVVNFRVRGVKLNPLYCSSTCPFYFFWMCINCLMSGKKCRPWSDAAVYSGCSSLSFRIHRESTVVWSNRTLGSPCFSCRSYYGQAMCVLINPCICTACMGLS